MTFSNLRSNKNLFINRKKEIAVCRELWQKLNLRAASLEQKAINLSGGNQQKVVLAKWLATQCDILIFDEPTRGIDVGAKREIYTLINQMAAEGKTILMISSEMPELIGMSDRIIVFCKGSIAGELKDKDISQENILKLAANY
jgi:ribose transport system ATP-binding protein